MHPGRNLFAQMPGILTLDSLVGELDQLANKIGRAADIMGEVKLKMIR